MSLADVCAQHNLQFAIVWVPCGDHLEAQADKSYPGTAPSFVQQSVDDFKFKPGQGIPGRAWEGKNNTFAPNVQALTKEKYPRLDVAKAEGVMGCFCIYKDDVIYEFGGDKPLEKIPFESF